MHCKVHTPVSVKQSSEEKTMGKELKRRRVVIVAVITNVYLCNGIPHFQLLKIFIGTQINSDCFVTHVSNLS